MIFSNIYKAITTDLKRFKKGKKNLKDHKHLLHPGLWLMDVRSSWRIGIGKESIQTKNAISPPYVDAKKKLYGIYYRLTGASLFFLTKGKSQEIEFDFDLVFFSRSDTIKFFDFKNEWVLTYYPNPIDIKTDIQELHKPFFSIFKTVDVEQIIINNITYKKEKFLSSPILALNPEKLKYAKDIFKNYNKYLNISKGTTQPGLFLNGIKYMATILSDPTFDAFVKRHSIQLDAIDKNLLYYPAHGDFNAENIIVHNDQVVIIDLDEFGTLLPGFFDLMYLCRPFELNEAYNKPGFTDLFDTCLVESFDSYRPDFSYLHLIMWIFYNTPYYREAVNLSPVNKNVLVSSWGKFKKLRVPAIDSSLAVTS